jgi:hypothetical protein
MMTAMIYHIVREVKKEKFVASLVVRESLQVDAHDVCSIIVMSIHRYMFILL